MNKQELVRLIAKDAELTQRQAFNALESALNIIMDTVAAGDSVQFNGFGTFASRERTSRRGRHPQTQEWIEIPAATVPTFTPGAIFREKVDR